VITELENFSGIMQTRLRYPKVTDFYAIFVYAHYAYIWSSKNASDFDSFWI